MLKIHIHLLERCNSALAVLNRVSVPVFEKSIAYTVQAHWTEQPDC